jgi:hypothetical protein
MTLGQPIAGTPQEPHCDPAIGCITCGDVAIELTVLRTDEARGLALCADGDDRRETVETALVGAVAPGDVLLVHAGTAIAHLGVAPDRNTPGREAEEVGR